MGFLCDAHKRCCYYDSTIRSAVFAALLLSFVLFTAKAPEFSVQFVYVCLLRVNAITHSEICVRIFWVFLLRLEDPRMGLFGLFGVVAISLDFHFVGVCSG